MPFCYVMALMIPSRSVQLALAAAYRKKARMIPRFARIIALSLGLLSFQLLAACAPSVELGRTNPAAPGPALWQVSDEDTTIYLFGTIHALPKDVDWYRPHIAEALQSADELVTEVDLADTGNLPQLVLTKAMLPAGENLRELLPQPERLSYEEAMVSQGLPVDTFDTFEPWYAAMTLSIIPIVNAGYDTNAGVENVLSSHFDPAKPRDHLETAEYQLDVFDQLPEDTQIAYLGQVASGVASMTADLDAMVDVWLEGDALALADLMNGQETDPIVYDRLLTRRNAEWAKWIDKRMEQPGTVFMAVGAGHLAGDDCVQKQLRKYGLKSRRVP